MKKYTYDEWVARGKKLFGGDIMEWAFVCPSCGHVQRVKDFKPVGGKPDHAYSMCIGRFYPNPKRAFGGDGKSWEKGEGPCDYTSGGLFNINPVAIVKDGKEMSAFDFAVVADAA